MDRPDQTTHFGFRDVPLGDKQTLVNDVFHSVASALRPDERSDVGGPAPGLEGHHDQRAQSAAQRRAVRAARRRRRHRRYRLPRRQGGRPGLSRHRLRHQYRHARGRPQPRRWRAISTTRCRSSRAMPRRWRFPTAASTPTPSRSASATCRGSMLALREAYRVLRPGSRFLCLEFSTVDVPGLDRLYDLFSFKVIPPLGRAVTGDAESYQYLVESIRKFPRPSAFAEMIRAAGFSRVKLAKPLRRHRGAAFGLAFVISATTHIARLARAAFVFAREGVFGVVDPSLVPPPGQLALRLARLIERPGAKSGPRLSRALTRLGPAYLKLGQFLATRPDVVGVAMARDLESLQDRLPPFSQAEAEAVIATIAGTPGGAGVCELRPAGRRGLDRAGASRRDRARRRAQIGRGQGAAAQRRRAFPPRPRRFLLCRAQRRGAFGRSAAAAADRGHQHDVALGRDGDGSAAGSGRAVRDGGEHARRSGFSRARRSTGTAPPTTC